MVGLTYVKLKALVLEGVTAATSLVVLLQNQNLLTGLCQDCGRRQPSDPTADHHGVQMLRNAVHTEPCEHRPSSSAGTWSLSLHHQIPLRLNSALSQGLNLSPCQRCRNPGPQVRVRVRSHTVVWNSPFFSTSSLCLLLVTRGPRGRRQSWLKTLCLPLVARKPSSNPSPRTTAAPHSSTAHILAAGSGLSH